VTSVGSPAWCTAVTAALGGGGAPEGDADPGSELDVVVADAPDGPVRLRWGVRDGRLAEVGVAAEAPAPAEVALAAADLLAVLRGELDPAAGFMRGDIKPVGAAGPWLDWLAALADPATRAALAAVASD